jgi:hypothetical protein
MEVFQQGVVIILGSTLKFIFGPVSGAAFGMPPLLTALFTTAGMMLTVIVVMIGGKPLKDWIQGRFPNGKKFSKKNRLIIKTRGKYGIYGIALLTPILFSPPVGALIALALTSEKSKVLFPMFVSASFWSVIFSFFLQTIKTLVL